MRYLFCIFVCFAINAHAQSFILATDDGDHSLNTAFSDVRQFSFSIELTGVLRTGVFDNPEINTITYQVFGVLSPGTPSGFEAFDLRREISGDAFYAQGSSLRFEIADTADLSNGVQLSELVADIDGNILVLNAREINNGRFHPPLLELRSDGTGRLQNSNNIHTQDPLLAVNFGDEYITDLVFESEAVTLLQAQARSSGGGSIHWLFLMVLLLLYSVPSIKSYVKS